MATSPSEFARRATVRALAAELRQAGVRCAGDAAAEPSAPTAPTGMEWLLRPMRASGGWLSEWMSEGCGTAAASVALAALRTQLRAGAPLLLVEGTQALYPPAWRGLDGNPTVIVRPLSDHDRSWAVEQALRCRGIGGVVAWVDRTSERFLRRLQLAVEGGGGKVCLIRPAEARREKCWGDVRFLVRPRPSERNAGEQGWRRVEIEVLGGRGGSAIAGQTAVADICDVTGAVRVVPPLADPAAARRAAGA